MGVVLRGKDTTQKRKETSDRLTLRSVKTEEDKLEPQSHTDNVPEMEPPQVHLKSIDERPPANTSSRQIQKHPDTYP
jgi:hypothetical protein